MPTTWTDRTKPSATPYTGRTSVSPVTPWTGRTKILAFYLIPGGGKMLAPGGGGLLISDEDKTDYTPRTKP